MLHFIPLLSSTIYLFGIGMEELTFIILVLFLGFQVFAIVDVLTGQFDPPEKKRTWIWVTLLAGIIGAIAYLIAGRKFRIRKKKDA